MNRPHSLLTLAAHRGALGAGAPELAQASPSDWEAMLALAVDHRVAPLLAEAVAHTMDLAVPGSVQAALRREQWRSSATSLLCENVLRQLAPRWSELGIDVVVLKGASVAHTLYARPELRLYHDVDVLCRARDYPTLLKSLRDAGFSDADTLEMRGTHEQLVPKPSPAESHAVRGFYDPSRDVKVEVHFDAMQLGLRDACEAEYWRCRLPLDVRGTHIWTLAPEHQFLHLAVHAHRHCYSRLSWLIELDLFVRRYGAALSWSKLLGCARAEGIAPAVRRALELLHAVLGTPLPSLPAPSIEERGLMPLYRALWPAAHVRELRQHERHRLLHFLPDDRDPRNVAYGLVLAGRRGEKLSALARRVLARA